MAATRLCISLILKKQRNPKATYYVFGNDKPVAGKWRRLVSLLVVSRETKLFQMNPSSEALSELHNRCNGRNETHVLSRICLRSTSTKFLASARARARVCVFVWCELQKHISIIASHNRFGHVTFFTTHTTVHHRTSNKLHTEFLWKSRVLTCFSEFASTARTASMCLILWNYSNNYKPLNMAERLNVGRCGVVCSLDDSVCRLL